MKFMVEFRPKPGCEASLRAAFEERGPNRTAGVSLKDAWIAINTTVIFVISESTSLEFMEKACQAWSAFGTYQIHPVHDIEEI